MNFAFKKFAFATLHNSILFVFYSFLYIPLIVIFLGSISSSSSFSLENITGKHYYELFFQEFTWRVFFSSLYISLISLIVSLLLSLSALYYIFADGNKKIIFYLIYPSIFSPEVVFATAFLILLSSFAFSMNSITLIIAHSIVGMGYSFPLLYQRWCEMDKHVITASYDLGASSWQTWNKIVIPFLKPTIIGAGILLFIISFDDYILTSFCGGNNIVTLPIFILSTLRTGITAETKALSILIMIFSLLIGISYIMYQKFSRNNK
jgi:spermidine/putrescine transport system permease protein